MRRTHGCAPRARADAPCPPIIAGGGLWQKIYPPYPPPPILLQFCHRRFLPSPIPSKRTDRPGTSESMGWTTSAANAHHPTKKRVLCLAAISPDHRRRSALVVSSHRTRPRPVDAFGEFTGRNRVSPRSLAPDQPYPNDPSPNHPRWTGLTTENNGVVVCGQKLPDARHPLSRWSRRVGCPVQSRPRAQSVRRVRTPIKRPQSPALGRR